MKPTPPLRHSIQVYSGGRTRLVLVPDERREDRRGLPRWLFMPVGRLWERIRVWIQGGAA